MTNYFATLSLSIVDDENWQNLSLIFLVSVSITKEYKSTAVIPSIQKNYGFKTRRSLGSYRINLVCWQDR